MVLAASGRYKGEQGGILTVEDLDEAIKLVGLYEIELERINHEMETRITQIKDQAVAEAALLQADRAEWLGKVETFITAKRAEVLKDRKSIKLNYGQIGFQKGKAKLVMPKKGTAEMEQLASLVEKLKASGASAYAEIGVKTEKSISGADVAKLEDTALTVIGVKRIEGKDEFFCKPDREKVREVSNG